jgi:IS5 family transposase
MKPYQQMSFADAEYANKGKVTRREKFLDQLDGLLPWQAMIDVIEPHYAPGNGRGRKPFALESILNHGDSLPNTLTMPCWQCCIIGIFSKLSP